MIFSFPTFQSQIFIKFDKYLSFPWKAERQSLDRRLTIDLSAKARFSRTYSQCFVIVLFLLFFCADAIAEKSPSIVLGEIVAGIKENKNPAFVVNYIHWETAFAEMKDSDKKLTGVNSASELKSYSKQFFTDPEPLLHKQLELHANNLPKDQQALLKSQSARMMSQVIAKFRSRREKLLGAEYSIGKEVVEADIAIVDLKSSWKGDTKRESIKFIKIGDKWFLPGAGKLGTSPTE